jgi:tetratricopeptide (TPR) repeat protein
MADVAALMKRARAAYAAQDMGRAVATIKAAAKAAPDNAQVAFLHAQMAYEGWHPAAHLYERALRLNPQNSDAVRNFALALVSEGERDRADALLSAICSRQPAWVEGQVALARLRLLSGQGDAADRGFAEGVAAVDGLRLRMVWFQFLATQKDWARAGEVLAGAGNGQSAALARLYLAAESGAMGEDGVIALDEYAALADPGHDITRVRHALRFGALERAGVIAAPHLNGPNAALFWPYQALVWRMMDDPLAQWLDGGFDGKTAAHHSIHDLPFTASELIDLVAFLRALHTASAPYPEQSVRGGTQTDRNLLLHHAPEICALRRKIEASVQAFARALTDAVEVDAAARDLGRNPPAPHPLLSHKKDMSRKVTFTGSWSVLLHGEGFHSAHTHPNGWVSSALYLIVPDDATAQNERPGPSFHAGTPAGHLALGMPPPELGLPLAPYRTIAPAPARQALFPSTLWHGTQPFADGERMTVAFDVGALT